MTQAISDLRGWTPKVGDLVKIPKTKSTGRSRNEFIEELLAKEYTKPYLVISKVGSYVDLRMDLNNLYNGALANERFDHTDLEPYTESASEARSRKEHEDLQEAIRVGRERREYQQSLNPKLMEKKYKLIKAIPGATAGDKSVTQTNGRGDVSGYRFGTTVFMPFIVEGYLGSWFEEIVQYQPGQIVNVTYLGGDIRTRVISYDGSDRITLENEQEQPWEPETSRVRLATDDEIREFNTAPTIRGYAMQVTDADNVRFSDQSFTIEEVKFLLRITSGCIKAKLIVTQSGKEEVVSKDKLQSIIDFYHHHKPKTP